MNKAGRSGSTWGRLLFKSMLPGLAFFHAQGGVRAQCSSIISTFPYSEGFEGAPAWTSGGQASDWAWGTPAHPLINGAGGGTKAWCVGGLQGSFYEYGQQSWLESPCFDLSSLEYPWISFKIFWECERQYDGMGFQYSLDQGATWQNLGSATGTPDCLGQNWFNTNYINALDMASPKQGWSGRVGATVGNCSGGQGSATWVTASQCMTDLAGEPSVKFRFIFGAGTICNSYDGIAVDDIFIGDAPANSAAFNFSCLGNTVEFQNASPLCPTSFWWNFDDTASGAANSSALPDPLHTFPGPGTYQVSLTVTGPCNATSTVVVPITIGSIELVAQDPSCSGTDGSISANVPGITGSLAYTWSNGASGPVIDGLSGGEYSVSVQGDGLCPLSASTTLVQQESTLQVSLEQTGISCAGVADGSLTVNVSGGGGAYTYAWTGATSTGPALVGLGPGEYSVIVTDPEGCTGSATAALIGPAPLVLDGPGDVQLCAGQQADISATVTGGTAPYTITYSPDGPVVSPSATSTYTVTSSDANGCAAEAVSVIVQVGGPALPVASFSDPSGCAPHCLQLQASGDGEIAWDLGDGALLTGTVIEHCYADAGIYSIEVTITDDIGCANSLFLQDTIVVEASPVASFNALPPVTTIKDPVIHFEQTSAGATTWTWHLGTSDSVSHAYSLSHMFSGVGCYDVSLVVANAAGCTDEATAEVCVEEEFAVYAPNAFTPNSDGINDVFRLFTSVRDPDFFRLEIYDRWGVRIHASPAPDEGWDGSSSGTVIPEGVYIWQLRMRDRTGALQERQGHVTLLR